MGNLERVAGSKSNGYQMSAPPRVTVLMAVHNGARYVRQAIGSILAQEYTGWEFVIIDDASTDETPQILKSYGDPRIRLFRNETNLGLAKSLNRGIEEARGEFIARIDCDDVSEPSRLRRQLQAMEADSILVLLGTCAYTYDEDTGLAGEMLHPLDNVSIRLAMCYHNPFVHSSVFIRRGVLVNNRLWYDERLPAAQDYELWTRLCKYGRVLNLSNRLITYRWHKENVSATCAEKQHALARQISSMVLQCVMPDSGTITVTPQRIHKILTALQLPKSDDIAVVRRLFDCIGRHSFVTAQEVRSSYMFWASRLLDSQKIWTLFTRANGRLLRSCRADAMGYLADRLSLSLKQRFGTGRLIP